MDENNKSFSDFRECKRTSSFSGVKPVVPEFPELSDQQIIDHDGRHYYLKKSNHLVLLTGFGTDDQGDYWEIMNSWGEDWCEKGFIKVRRDTNEYNVESAPIVFYWAGENVSVPEADTSVSISEGLYITFITLLVLFGAAVVGLGVWICILIKRKKDFVQIVNNE